MKTLLLLLFAGVAQAAPFLEANSTAPCVWNPPLPSIYSSGVCRADLAGHSGPLEVLARNAAGASPTVKLGVSPTPTTYGGYYEDGVIKTLGGSK